MGIEVDGFFMWIERNGEEPPIIVLCFIGSVIVCHTSNSYSAFNQVKQQLITIEKYILLHHITITMRYETKPKPRIVRL